MTESDLYRKIRPPLKKLGFVLTRIENVASTGVPDVYFAREPCIDGWIELKIIRGNKFQHPITPAQEAWHKIHTKLGVPTFFMAWDPRDESIYIWWGNHATDLRKADNVREVGCDYLGGQRRVEKGKPWGEAIGFLE